MPIPRVTLDYETRSRAKLELCGAIEYAKHESTSIFCLAYKINDGDVGLWIPEKQFMPVELEMGFYNGILVAHNAAFERAITRWTLPRYDTLSSDMREWLTKIPISRWRCTAAKAAASSLPRNLEAGAKILELSTQKDMAGNKLIKKYMKPRKPTKNNPSHWWCDKDDLQRIYDYCMTDVQAEFELDEELPDLSKAEQKVWELDQKINDRGVMIDIPTVKLILKMIKIEMREITARVHKLSGGTIASATQRALVLDWVNYLGAEMKNLQAQTIRDKLLEPDLHPYVKAMLEYRQASSKTSTGKYISMLHAVGKDHRARELLLYHGTIPTARWSGKRIQPHNFPRPTISKFNSDEAIVLMQKGGLKAIRKKYGEHKVMDVLVSSVRGMLVASPECEFFCADYASIEARLAFWVAEHEEGLEAFRQNKKLYEMMAAEAFDMRIEDVAKDSLERFVGKESVLGCQYGMGWKKFKSQCHKKGMLSVTDEIASRAVYTYRKVHYPIPRLWSNLEEAAISAIQNLGERFFTNKVTFYTHDKWLNIKLPSGRRLRYFKPQLKQKQLSNGRMVPEIRYQGMEHHVWQECAIWGGIFCNHIVQGTARDLMVNGIFNIENAGYKFLLSVHDEGLSERKKGFGSVEEYVKLMTKLPKWAADAPITAEGWKGLRYRK